MAHLKILLLCTQEDLPITSSVRIRRPISVRERCSGINVSAQRKYFLPAHAYARSHANGIHDF